MSQMVPELLPKDDFIYPHELPKKISTEPHFRRVWQHYREYVFKTRFDELVSEGKLTDQEASAFKEFVSLSNEPSFNMFIYAKLG